MSEQWDDNYEQGENEEEERKNKMQEMEEGYKQWEACQEWYKNDKEEEQEMEEDYQKWSKEMDEAVASGDQSRIEEVSELGK